MATLCLDIGGTHIKSGLYDGGWLATKEVPTFLSARRTGKEFLDQVDALFTSYRKANRKRIGAIHAGFPGVFEDRGKGIVSTANMPLKGYPLKGYLEKRYKVRVLLENDANCFALGEQAVGAAKGFSHVVGITLGTGIGIGIVIDGRIYHGKANAGEMGHSTYLDATFEDYVSRRALLRYAKDAGIGASDPKELAHPRYRKVWQTYGAHLGNIVLIIARLLDPEIVVIGGQMARAHALFSPAMRKACRGYPVRVAFSSQNLALDGAARLRAD